MIKNNPMKKVQVAIFAIFAVFLMPSTAWAGTYYDATNGKGSNTGTSIN